MSKFKSYKFSDLYEMSSGISTKPEQAGHGAPFLSFKTVFNNIFLPSEFIDLMDTSVNEQEIYSIQEGDIFLTRTSETLDELGMSSVAVQDYPKATFSGFLKRLRPKQTDITYHKFMAFYLRSDLFRRTMSNNAIMTLRASLNEQIFSYLYLHLPSFQEQKKIGDFLFSIYRKIELNNRINAELEQMARILYDYWFIQFDFPDGNGKPYKSSGGKMVYNEMLKREVPEGWEIERLGDYSKVKKGTLITEKTADLNGEIKVVSAGLDFSYHHSRANCDQNTITISASGASAGFVNFWREPIFACDCTIVRGSDDVETMYVLYFLKSIQEYLYKQARGSAQPHVYPKDIEQLLLVIPSKRVINLYKQVVIPINNSISNNLKQNRQLASLQDWLLPMLMNGQAKVFDREQADKRNVSVVTTHESTSGKDVQLSIPSNRKAFAKQVLAGKVISRFKDDLHFTDIKFQKIQFLAEHVIGADLNLNYYYQAAGPYDNVFMHTIYNDLKKNKWYDCKDRKFTALEKQIKIEEYYQNYFGPATGQLDKLFRLLSGATEAKSEIIATIYAVWNNFIIEGKPVAEDELIQSFYNWSERKHQYTRAQVLEGLQWLRENKLEPTGFGKLIKKANSKK